MSLTLAIISAFFAVLGQQWLVYYRKQSGGGVKHQRWEHLRRYLGARHWRLEGIMHDILPALLQLALVIFAIAFLIYLRTLSKTMCYVIATPMAIALGILLLISVAGVMDPNKWCPFKNTLSHFLQLIDEIPTKYKPLTYLIAPLVLAPFILPLYVVVFIVGWIGCLWRGLQVYSDLFRGRVPDWLRNNQGPLVTVSREASRVSTNVFRQLMSSLAPPEEGTALLQAVAVRRVLYTSKDFNTLIYTAINIQAMRGKEGAEYLLKDETVHRRLKELIKSSERTLFSAFLWAFAHLLLGGQSAELFVGQEERHLYRSRRSFPRSYIDEPHPLKETVGFISDQLKTCMELPGIRPDNFVETVLYFELLELLLDEKSGSQELSKWLDRVIQRQQPSKVSTLLVISFVADTVRILNQRIDSAGDPSGLRISFGSPEPEQEGQGGLNQERERDRLLTVQQQRVEVVKQLISKIGWEIQSVPSHSWQR